MRGIGQIENLSKFSEPDIAVITNIGSSHIGRLGSKENITYAKCEITKHLNPNGVVIIPANDLFLEEILKKNWNGRIIKVELLDINQNTQSINKNNSIFSFSYTLFEINGGSSFFIHYSYFYCVVFQVKFFFYSGK